MTPDQVSYILSNKPDHMTEVRLYLKNRQRTVHSLDKKGTAFAITQGYGMLVITSVPIQPSLA